MDALKRLTVLVAPAASNGSVTRPDDTKIADTRV
jgi:hypothetical protein